MKKETILILLCFTLLTTNGCVSSTRLDSSELKTILPGNTLLIDQTNELYAILPKGNLIYMYGKTKEKSAGKWFFRKSKESDWYTNGSSNKDYDVFCTPIGKTLLENSTASFRCTVLYNNSWSEEKYDKRGRRKFKAYIGRCNNSNETDRVSCNPEYAGLISFSLHENSLEEKSSRRFALNTDDTIIDNNTSLQWMKCTLGQESFFNLSCHTDAKEFSNYLEVEEYIKKFNQQGFAGYYDWRLPTPNELVTLVKCNEWAQTDKVSYCNDVISNETSLVAYSNFSTFPNVYLTSYRSKETVDHYGEGRNGTYNTVGVINFKNGWNGNAWEVGPFKRGVFDGDQTNHNYVRLVRGKIK